MSCNDTVCVLSSCYVKSDFYYVVYMGPIGPNSEKEVVAIFSKMNLFFYIRFRKLVIGLLELYLLHTLFKKMCTVLSRVVRTKNM